MVLLIKSFNRCWCSHNFTSLRKNKSFQKSTTYDEFACNLISLSTTFYSNRLYFSYTKVKQNCLQDNDINFKDWCIKNLETNLKLETFSYCSFVTYLNEFGYGSKSCVLSDPSIYTKVTQLFVFFFKALSIIYPTKAFGEFLSSQSDKNNSFLSSVKKMPPFVRDREFLIFYSILLYSDSLKEAYEDYYQTKKRCVIRDYWQWISFEQPEYNENNNITDKKTVHSIIVFKKDNDNNTIIIPRIFFDKSFPLTDHGFDPTDGVWKPLLNNRLPSQRGDLLSNYNLSTCAMMKVGKTSVIYRYFNKVLGSNFETYFDTYGENIFCNDPEKEIYFAIIPPRIAKYIFLMFFHLQYVLDLDPAVQEKSIFNTHPTIKTEYLKNDDLKTTLKNIIDAYLVGPEPEPRINTNKI
jgi:hypothetical protein